MLCAMFARMEPDADDELISSITPDVMTCLGRSSYFERLDELLSPEDSSAPNEKCDGSFRLSETMLLACRFERDIGRHHRCAPIQGRILRL
jgi:hypothetical protein